ncbi:MAG: hypothetical protein BEN19_05205 [Epulopiscium sp. Nuni2H_MBin003]|nr:MAG: hypothetical protein BEN19_05205 [Epulopiscium sp. Nuni2H_MBin003]
MRYYILLIVLILVGCQAQSAQSDEQKEETMAITEDSSVLSLNMNLKKQPDTLMLSMHVPQTLHPIYNTDETVAQVMNLMFDTLFNIEPDGSVSYNIAKHFTINEQNNSITIVLHDDIMWHDGEILDAYDVVFSINTIKNATESIYKSNVANMSYATVTAPNTVKIFYNQPFSGILQTLFFPVIPEHVYSVSYSTATALSPIGSGAYQFSYETPLKSLTLIANDNYFKGSPNISNVNIIYAPDTTAIISSFDQNVIDVIYTDVMDWGKYTKDSSSTIYEIPTNKYEFIGLNFDNDTLNNIDIRNVLSKSLDAQQIIDIYYLGKGDVSVTPVNPNSYLYSESILNNEYDISTIKSTLASAGFNDSNPLTLNLLVNSDNIERVKVAEGIVKMYDQVGIIIELELVDVTTFTDRVNTGDYELFLGGWKLSYMPDLSFAFHSQANNFINYYNAEMDSLLEVAFKSSEADILDSYQNLQYYIETEIPYISLYFKSGALIVKDRLSGTISPDPLNIFSNIHLWELKH